jgi:hypothetical protein
LAFDERLGHESGEWFERYLEVIFRHAGFQTVRDRLFFKDVKHEIDVWATPAGVFAVNTVDRGQLRRYAEYLKRYHIALWDKNEVQRWQDAMQRHKTDEYQKKLCDALGILIRPKTGTEKAFGFLKKVGNVSLKTASVGMKALDEMTAEPKKRRRRRSKSR